MHTHGTEKTPVQNLNLAANQAEHFRARPTEYKRFAFDAAHYLQTGLGRRRFIQAAVGIGATGVLTACSASNASVSSGSVPTGSTGSGSVSGTILNPDQGEIKGDHYLKSNPDEVLWGYVPTVHATPLMTIKSGETITIDAVSHEGILEDQGRDPEAFFGEHGVESGMVLEDAKAIAAEYNRHQRDFDTDGPHVITGPIAVEGAEPGDVLKIETLDAQLRVPYGVVSSRHGKGALGRLKDGSAPAGITLEEVMPPVSTDNRSSGVPTDYGNVSVFTSVEGDQGVMASGDMQVKFPLNPFFGTMGVAFSEATTETDATANSIPPTLGGGNIDISALGVGSSFYLPVNADGALFYVGDPHMAMGDGEVSLTAMEGSLRGTFRLTICKQGSGDAPSVAYKYPFAETDEYWIPTGLSDPDGSAGGEQNTDLNIAMRRAVVNALDFLENDKGMDRAIAYAYLSAAADFVMSQVVDRTTGAHGLIRKADFS